MEEKQQKFDTLLTHSRQKVSLEVSEYIIKVVKIYYKLDDTYIESRSRKIDVVMPRQMAMYLIRQNTTLSLKQIGRLFSKDHSTVLHSTRKINDYLFYDQDVKQNLKDLERIIKFRSTAINENVDWRKEYYYLDMDSFHSLRLGQPKQAIIMTGFTDSEVHSFSKILTGVKYIRHHTKTGMYILEKLEELNHNQIKNERTESQKAKRKVT